MIEFKNYTAALGALFLVLASSIAFAGDVVFEVASPKLRYQPLG